MGIWDWFKRRRPAEAAVVVVEAPATLPLFPLERVEAQVGAPADGHGLCSSEGLRALLAGKLPARPLHVDQFVADHQTWSREEVARFREDASHARVIELTEMYFPNGLHELVEGPTGFPKLERLSVRGAGGPDLVRFIDALASARWATRLVDLELAQDGHDPAVDAALATLFASPCLGALRRLEIGCATLGNPHAQALEPSPVLAGLEDIVLRGCILSKELLAVLANAPSLRIGTLRLCGLPALSPDEARLLGERGALRELHLVGTFRVTDEARAKSVARCLARVPALHALETLALADEEWSLAALRILSRSLRRGRLQRLVVPLTTTDEDIERLRAELPTCAIGR